MNNKTKSNFDIFNEPPGYFSYGYHFEGDKAFDIPLTTLLGIENENLKPFSKGVLSRLKDNEDIKELINGIWAYQQFQDILDLSLNIDGGEREMFNRHYCYYESLIYLRECAIAWLDGNSLASMTLLRPFLELSTLHIYWLLRSEKTKYRDFYAWFSGNKDKKPPFRNLFDYIFSNLPCREVVEPRKIKQLKEVLYGLFQTFSSYNHTPQVEESVVGIGEGNTNLSEQTFFYCLESINIFLRQIINLYVLAYPMCLFPVDKYKKWGYEGPVGLFFDKTNYIILEQFVGKDNIAKIHTSLSKMQIVNDLTSWYESFTDITNAEIEDQWAEFVKNYHHKNTVSDAGGRIALRRAEIRTLGWQINYYNPTKPNDNVTEEQINLVRKKLRDW